MPSYAIGHHESVLRSHRWRTAQNSAAYLLPHLGLGARVLDVGCGPGTITADLANIVGPGGEVLGIDTSPAVIAAAQQQSRADLHHLRFAVDDIMSPTTAGEREYDVVHAHQVLQHLTDPVAALRQMRRLAKPGGVVAVREADYSAMAWYPQLAGMDRWLSTYQAVARRNGVQPDAGRRLLGWAQRAGFSVVTPSASVWCFATAQDREWWGALQADRITQSAVADQARAASLADDDALQEMAQAWRAWAKAADGWFVVVHAEVLCLVEAADR